eukprot:3838795-Rhodomonas_salina.1
MGTVAAPSPMAHMMGYKDLVGACPMSVPAPHPTSVRQHIFNQYERSQGARRAQRVGAYQVQNTRRTSAKYSAPT